MHIGLRPARDHDFAFCWALYTAEGAWMIESLNLDIDVVSEKFRRAWRADETRIVAVADQEIGWMQQREQDGALYLAQIFVDKAVQNRGIGTEVVNRLLREAVGSGQAVTLGVIRNNPAVRLYKRLGFYVTSEDEQKLYMRREPNVAAPIANLRG